MGVGKGGRKKGFWMIGLMGEVTGGANGLSVMEGKSISTGDWSERVSRWYFDAGDCATTKAVAREDGKTGDLS